MGKWESDISSDSLVQKQNSPTNVKKTSQHFPKINICSKHKKNRRSLRRNKKSKFTQKLKLIGFNAAGLSSKLHSFNYFLGKLKPSIFFIEETKLLK